MHHSQISKASNNKSVTPNKQVGSGGKSMPAVPALQQKMNNTGLPADLKTGIENLSGFSMDDVKVNYNSDKPAQLQALAYAQGAEIHVAPGQEKHLPHEAWHVVQQKQGRVKPTIQMKGGIPVNDDMGLEREADIMGAKAINTPVIQNIVKHTAVEGQTAVQRKGEAEALGNIVSSEMDGKQMRRGNNRNSIKDTGGKSMAWISYLRSDDLAIDLKAKVKALYLAATKPEPGFEAWYSNRKIMLQGLVYKHVQFGNCGEFASALYGELQQSTTGQYVYKASWMWETKETDQTPYMKKYKIAYPGRIIKAHSADHAFVVTYPELVSAEALRFVKEDDLKDRDEADPVSAECFTRTRYKMADMKKDQAMVADGWLDREVKTLDQAGLDDSNALLTDPTQAGAHTIEPGMIGEIVTWAEAFKARVEADMGFKQKAHARRNYAGGYGDKSHKGQAGVDKRPAYIKAFHGVVMEQVQNFNEAWANQKAQLIAYIKEIDDALITGVGKLILAAKNKGYSTAFFQALTDSNKNALLNTLTQEQVAAFKTLVQQMEGLIGQGGFAAKRSEAATLYNSLPGAIRTSESPFHEWVLKLNAATDINKKVTAFKTLVQQMEGLVGQDGFTAKRAEAVELYNSLPKGSKAPFREWALKLNAATDTNKKIGQYKTMVGELEGLIGKEGFQDKSNESGLLYNSIPEPNRAIVQESEAKARAAVVIQQKITTFKTLVQQMEGLVGQGGYAAKRAEALGLYKSLPDTLRNDDSPLREWVLKAKVATDANKKIKQYKIIVGELEGLIGKEGFQDKNIVRINLYNSLPAPNRAALQDWRARAKVAIGKHQEVVNRVTTVQSTE